MPLPQQLPQIRGGGGAALRCAVVGGAGAEQGSGRHDEKPSDPLAKEVDRYMGNGDLYSVSWNFTSFPSQTFKDDFGASLLQYAQGGKEWQAVVDDMKAGWASEKAMTK